MNIVAVSLLSLGFSQVLKRYIDGLPRTSRSKKLRDLAQYIIDEYLDPTFVTLEKTFSEIPRAAASA